MWVDASNRIWIWRIWKYEVEIGRIGKRDREIGRMGEDDRIKSGWLKRFCD